MIIPDQAKAVRAMREMTQSKTDIEMAKKLNVNKTTISNIKVDRSGIGRSMLYELACFTDLPMSEIKRRLNADC